MEAFFTKQDLEDFASWLNLNKEAMTWQGRYEDDFDSLWKCFFEPDLSYNQILDRFDYVFNRVDTGPLISWFTWLRDSFICYTFLFKKYSIIKMTEDNSLSSTNISMILRDYFINQYPEYEVTLSDMLKVTNELSPNLKATMSSLESELDFDGREKKFHYNSLMQNMEVTLFESWGILYNKMRKDLGYEESDIKNMQNKISLKRQFLVVRDVVGYSLTIILIVFAVRELNIAWEKKILDKVSIYEPQFKWLDKTLFYQEKDQVNEENFNLAKSELDKVETKEGKFEKINFADDTRYETESEVTLTSWDSLPKDFDIATLEQSGYEEDLKGGGYRDTRYGRTKVYRVMMKSVDTELSKEKLVSLLEKYEVTRVDNVKPGKAVPGGVYYNLYVPRKYLKEFMAQVMDVDDSILYESRTRTARNPPGMNKVFIWIKSI